jgi:hypothetical protein
MKITLVLVFLFFVQLMDFKLATHDSQATLIQQEVTRQIPNIKAAILADIKANGIHIGNRWIIR